MKIAFAKHHFEGERVIRTSPLMSNRISSEWYRRPHLFTGRALTADTLISNTKHHLRHLQLAGRHVSRGVIQGLTLSHYQRQFTDQEGMNRTEQWLRLSAGRGITPWGEDVTLPETSDIFIHNVAVWESENAPQGAGIFLLEPLEILDEVVSDTKNQCQWDEDQDPFDDEQIVDGCRLVFMPWPTGLLGSIPQAEDQQFRNRLVYQIFDYEQAHPDTLFPWEQVGVPLGLAYITEETGQIMFIDQQAVVRQGGAPLSTRSLLTLNGTPFLWESRIHQFVGHLADIRQTTDELPPAHTLFDTLPPVGVLPKQALNFDDMRSDFFPSQFIIEASPIPEEQLEVAMNASAGLSPFDLYQPEKIKLLVPVPQAVYQPDLLKTEIPDPIFLETLRKLIGEIRQWLANRTWLRDMADRVIGGIDQAKVPEFGEDTDAIPDEAVFPVFPDHDDTLKEFGSAAVSAVSNLRTWIRENAPGVSSSVLNPLIPTDGDPPGFRDEFQGLENFIADLKEKITKTEDLLNSGYVKSETQMYRLRRLLKGNIKASRMATSPAMASIVGDQESIPTLDDVEQYFNSAITTEEKVNITPEELAPEELSGTTENEKIDNALAIMKKRESGQDISTDELMAATRTLASVAASRYGDANKTIAMLAKTQKTIGPVYSAQKDLYYATAATPQVIFKYTQPVIIPQKMAVRDKPIIERLYESPAMEVKSNAVNTKSAIFDLLAQVPLEIDEKVSVTDSKTAIITRSQYDAYIENLTEPEQVILDNRSRLSEDFASIHVAPLTDDEEKYLADQEPAVSPERIQAYFSNLSANNKKNMRSVKDPLLSKNIREGLFDPDPADGDEANYFSTGVTALEHGLNAMRLIEKRLKDYKKAVTQCGNVLLDLQTNARLWKDKLGEIDDKLVVLRHDALVTRSLYEEEKARLTAVNEQRRAILDTYVTSLVFVRPRLVDPRLDVPSIPLAAEYVNPVPACLAKDYEAVGELDDMLDVFREIPIAWLTEAKGLIRQVNTVPGVAELMTKAAARTARVIAQAPAQTVSQKIYNTHAFGRTACKIIAANQQVKQTAFKEKAVLDTVKLNTMTWLDLVSQAETRVSLADLIEKGRGFSKQARQAAIVMENLEDVAVCLYHLVDGMEPVVKLQWANLLSIYDKPVDLRYLEALPSFDKIDITLRKDLQNMVDWLFSQVDIGIAQARQTMNDLVRVCILLAAHAPVSTIIKGYVSEPSSGKVGDVIDVAVNQGIVKIGMTATVMTQQSLVVQGVVTDVGAGAARIKVTQTKDGKPDFSIDQGAQIKFVPETSATQMNWMMKSMK
ncbi:hypothetical protein [uncultured Desulfobacter sp.]|uniref:hypothetical protein n=1 Tax=uncultured Desulfobacter sp. TaxID=240139 RepID=UPI0029C7F187|nr:hypothetical protein [uncultured Desulfobacter sp.]